MSFTGIAVILTIIGIIYYEIKRKKGNTREVQEYGV